MRSVVYQDIRAHIGLRLPAVGRMRFLDVHHEELHLIAVLFVHCIQGANLTPEGRSRVGTEDECDRFFIAIVAQGDLAFAIGAFQGEVGGDVTFLETIWLAVP